MPILDQKVIGNGKVFLIEEVLTDGSRVYNVGAISLGKNPHRITLACEDMRHANNLYNAIILNTMDIS